MAAALCGMLGAPSPAAAQSDLLLDAEGSIAGPISSPQAERFGWGGGLSVAARVPVLPWLVPTLRLGLLVLSDGGRPVDPTLADPGVGALGRLSLGLRLRLAGLLDPQSPRRGDGGWLELGVGGAVTGSFVRPVFEVALGWGFEVADIADVGPALRLVHVVHFDDPLDDSGALVLLFGAEVVLLESAPALVEAEPEIEAPSDRDGDEINDPDDACPDVAEDFDGDADTDGCPEEDADRDADGIIDRLDVCPDEPEDLDGQRDGDGCPDLDDDRDGILDADDHCPLDPEVVNGVDDLDGCPDVGLITFVDDRIVLDERVLFELNRSRVRHAARAHLVAIVELWRQHPEWARIRIEGHADERGTDEVNLELSTRRAERVVEELVALGMPAEMFEFIGYGATHPRDTRGTEPAMEANRRVEFVVLDRHPAPAATETP